MFFFVFSNVFTSQMYGISTSLHYSNTEHNNSRRSFRNIFVKFRSFSQSNDQITLRTDPGNRIQINLRTKDKSFIQEMHENTKQLISTGCYKKQIDLYEMGNTIEENEEFLKEAFQDVSNTSIATEMYDILDCQKHMYESLTQLHKHKKVKKYFEFSNDYRILKCAFRRQLIEHGIDIKQDIYEQIKRIQSDYKEIPPLIQYFTRLSKMHRKKKGNIKLVHFMFNYFVFSYQQNIFDGLKPRIIK